MAVMGKYTVAAKKGRSSSFLRIRPAALTLQLWSVCIEREPQSLR